MDIHNYLNRYKTKKGQSYTHTSIGTPKASYCIDNYEEFIIHYKEAIANNEKLYLVEKPLEVSPLRIDLDFQFKKESKNRILTEKVCMEIVEDYVETIENIYATNDDLTAYVMLKPKHTVKDDFIKDGIHIVFPNLILSYNEQFYIRKLILNNGHLNFLNKLPVLNDIYNIVDNAIIKQNCWQMYGSSKTANSPYKVMYKFNINCDNDERTYKLHSVEIENTNELIDILSMKQPFYENIMLEIDDKDAFNSYVETITPKVKETVEQIGPINEDKFNDIVKVAVNGLSVDTASDYNSWMAVIFAIVNEGMICKIKESEIELLVHSFAEKADNYCYQATDKLINNAIINYPRKGNKIGTILMYLKKDNFQIWTKLTNNFLDKLIMNAVSSDGTNYSMAKIVNYLFKDTLYFQPLEKGQIWHYLNDNNHWKQNYETIPSFIRNYIHLEVANLFRKKLKIIQLQLESETKGSDGFVKLEDIIVSLTKIIRNCETTSYGTNVITALKGLVEYKIKDDGKQFVEKLDSNVNIFAFNNKLYDMDKEIFRKILPEDFVSTSTNYILEDSTDEDIKYIETFLKSFHKTTKKGVEDVEGDKMFKYMLYSMVSSMWGDNSKAPFFHIYTGEGCNGKSFYLRMVNFAFGGYFMTLNTATVTIQTKNINQNSDLDNIKGKRVVIFNEPPEGSKLQVEIFKQITDDDLTTKGMYKSPVTFRAQCTMFGPCNYLPLLSGTDGGTARRARVTPFNNTFIDDYDEKTALPNQRPKDNDLDANLKTDRYRNAFMNYLINCFPEVKKCLLDGKYDALCPDICKERTRNYLKQSNPIVDWLDNTYIKVTEYDSYIEEKLAKEYLGKIKQGNVVANNSCYVAKSQMFNLYSKDFSVKFKIKRNEFFKEDSKIYSEERIRDKGIDCEVYVVLKLVDTIYANDDDDDDSMAKTNLAFIDEDSSE